jgi:hypothetical protein
MNCAATGMTLSLISSNQKTPPKQKKLERGTHFMN